MRLNGLSVRVWTMVELVEQGHLWGIQILKKGRLQLVNGNSLLLTVDLDGVVLGGALENRKRPIVR